ncbi:MAG: FKBP-type peptidyl-prolyl cis-trans isomerase [Ilumatobacteraceae bacterium]
MGTDKRARQKANRLQRQHEQQRAARVGTIKRNVVRWSIVAVAALAGVVFIAWLGGAFDGDDTESDTGTAPTIPEAPTLDTPDKPEVVIPESLPTELVVTTLIEGDGPAAASGDTVLVQYVGVRSADGTEFDNSYDRGSPFPVELGAGRVIAGWDEGLVGARAGERRQLDIPADLAYGDAGAGDVIQPGDALTFVIDVLEVTPAS